MGACFGLAMAHASFSISRRPQDGFTAIRSRASYSARYISLIPDSPGSLPIFSSMASSSSSPCSSSNR